MRAAVAILAGFLLGSATLSRAALIHYYNFDEGSGSTVFDQVVENRQHGTFGAGKNPSHWTTGRYGGGLQFFGVRGDGDTDVPPSGVPGRPDRLPAGPAHDVVDFGADSSFELLDRGTIAVWYRQDPGPSGDVYQQSAVTNPDNSNWIVVKGDDPFNYILHNDPANGHNARLELIGQGDLRSANSGVALPVSQWVHLAASWDKDLNKKSLYVNGAEVGTGNFNGLPADQGATFLLGGQSATTGLGRGFIGCVDELKIYDTFLDASGVQQAMLLQPLTAGILSMGFREVVALEFESRLGVLYLLQSTDDATQPFISTGAMLFGDGGTMVFCDPSPLSGSRLYRVAEQID